MIAFVCLTLTHQEQALGRSNEAFEHAESEDHLSSPPSSAGRSRNAARPRQRQQVRDLSNGFNNVAFEQDDDQQSITPPPPYPIESTATVQQVYEIDCVDYQNMDTKQPCSNE